MLKSRIYLGAGRFDHREDVRKRQHVDHITDRYRTGLQGSSDSTTVGDREVGSALFGHRSGDDLRKIRRAGSNMGPLTVQVNRNRSDDLVELVAELSLHIGYILIHFGMVRHVHDSIGPGEIALFRVEDIFGGNQHRCRSDHFAASDVDLDHSDVLQVFTGGDDVAVADLKTLLQRIVGVPVDEQVDSLDLADDHVTGQSARPVRIKADMAKNDDVVHVGAGDIDRLLTDGEDLFVEDGETRSVLRMALRLRIGGRQTDDSDGEAVEVIDLIRLEYKVSILVEHVGGEDSEIRVLFGELGGLNQALGPVVEVVVAGDDRIIAEHVQKDSYNLAFEQVRQVRSVRNVAGIQHENVVRDGAAHFQHRGQFGIAHSAVAGSDPAVHVVGVDDEQIEVLVTGGVLDDRGDAQGELSRFDRSGDLDRYHFFYDRSGNRGRSRRCRRRSGSRSWRRCRLLFDFDHHRYGYDNRYFLGSRSDLFHNRRIFGERYH
ncbi:MAG: hypothetical protein BWY50_01553 [Spirochaetes bacterium ADurb.Bin315]|nr:MAG: hypothetical protein BWY50_01553 [Spirochaetes bacterium ADurb.Bin315]